MVALTAATAKVLLGNITNGNTDIEVLIEKSIGDLELQGAPTLPTPTGSAGTYSWALSNQQHAAVINVLKENYAGIFLSASNSSGSSNNWGIGPFSEGSSQNSSASSAGGGSKVLEVAKACALKLRGNDTSMPIVIYNPDIET